MPEERPRWMQKELHILRKHFPHRSVGELEGILLPFVNEPKPDFSVAESLIKLVEDYRLDMSQARGVFPEWYKKPSVWHRSLKQSLERGRAFQKGFLAGKVGQFQLRGERSPHVEALHALSAFTPDGERVATLGFHLFDDWSENKGVPLMWMTNVQGVQGQKQRLDSLRKEAGVPWPRLLGILALAHAEKAGVQEVRGFKGVSSWGSKAEVTPSRAVLYDGTWRSLGFKQDKEGYWVKRPPFLNARQRELLRKLGLHP